MDCKALRKQVGHFTASVKDAHVSMHDHKECRLK